MTNATESKIRKSNRKNAPKFTLLMFACTLLGGVFGYSSQNIAPESLREALDHISNALISNAWWLLIAVALFSVTCCTTLYLRIRQALSRWDGEDERTEKTMDTLLNSLIGVFNTSFIVSLALFSLFMLDIAKGLNRIHLASGFIAFVISLISMIVFQQKSIDMVRRINPEKTASAYDPKFHKKWIAECDERERQQIGQASYTALKVFLTACPLLFLALLMLNIASDGWLGAMPALCVALIWIIVSVAYIIACAKIEK